MHSIAPAPLHPLSQASDSTQFEWCPDGVHFVTATTAPRLRVGNGYVCNIKTLPYVCNIKTLLYVCNIKTVRVYVLHLSLGYTMCPYHVTTCLHNSDTRFGTSVVL